MNYPTYRVVTAMGYAHIGDPFNSFADFDTQEKAEEYIKQNKSPTQRLIIKIISDRESYFTYLEPKT